jgi:hypothetical protein
MPSKHHQPAMTSQPDDPTPDEQRPRAPAEFNVSEEQLARIDAVRGELTREEWIQRALLRRIAKDRRGGLDIRAGTFLTLLPEPGEEE